MTEVKSQNQKKDKTGKAYEMIDQLKTDKRKGQLILHFDGSGIIAKAELKVDI